MREIKFRAWDEKAKFMWYIDDLYWFEEEGVHDSSGDGHNSKYELMQYTGLKDKNGNEIYEGDILKATPNGAEYIGKVYYEDAQWFGAKDYLHYAVTYSGAEVIGNIYENPELLKEAENDAV